MSVSDLIPIMIPGAVIQIGIQAYYIRHCWLNPELSGRQKAWYIVLIAVLNLPAAAFYCFLTRKKTEPYPADKIGDMDVNDGIKQGITVLLFISYEILCLNIVNDNLGQPNQTMISAILSVGFVLMAIQALWLKKTHGFFYYLVPALLLLAALGANYLDSSVFSQFLLMVAVAGVINNYPPREANLYALSAFSLYMVSRIANLTQGMTSFDGDYVVPNLYVDALIYLLVYAAFYNMKKQLLQNRLLEKAYEELREQSLRLEQMAAITERNRIAGEIHDNVGHILTTAIISIEAGEKLMDRDARGALGKFRLARDQVRDGLHSIRDSVKAISRGPEEKAFVPRLRGLLEQIAGDSGLAFSPVIDINSELLPIQQSVLLQAVRECATNTLRHGGGSHVDLLLQEHGGNIQMTFSDDGKGAGEFEYGFGLNNMQQRVHGLGGTLGTETAPGEGFSVSIMIPAGAPGGRP